MRLRMAVTAWAIACSQAYPKGSAAGGVTQSDT